jgi:uncharacterized membrane protein
MIRVRIQTSVARPVEEVFAYLSDFSNIPAYDPAVRSIRRTSDGPVGVGSTWTHIRTMGRRAFEAPITMTEFEPNRRLAIESGEGSIRVRAVQTFEPSAAGTTVTEDLDMRIAGLARLAEPFIRRSIQKQAPEVHRRFKALLEQRA